MRLLIPVLALIGGGAVVTVTYFQVLSRDAGHARKQYLVMKPTAGLSPQFQKFVTQMSSTDARERATAAIELRRLGKDNGPAMPYLVQLLEDRTPVCIDPETNGERGLASFTCPGALAAAALAHSDQAGVTALLRAMSRSHSEDIRRSALEGAGECEHPDAIKALVATLGNDDALIRESAQLGLKRTGSRATDALAECLHNGNARVRVNAAELLAALSDQAALHALLRAAADKNPEVSTAADYGLSRVNHRRCIGMLVDCLSDPTVREPAVRELRQLDHSQRTWLLVEALQNPSNSDLRFGAARALTELKDPAAADALRKAKNDPDARVRDAAGRALSALATKG